MSSTPSSVVKETNGTGGPIAQAREARSKTTEITSLPPSNHKCHCHNNSSADLYQFASCDLLVCDATTGGNALFQAREFHKAIPLTGVIVTKLDGSGKGGVLVAIQQELGVPTRFIGLGERVEDFQPFDSKTFVEELL